MKWSDLRPRSMSRYPRCGAALPTGSRCRLHGPMSRRRSARFGLPPWQAGVRSDGLREDGKILVKGSILFTRCASCYINVD